MRHKFVDNKTTALLRAMFSLPGYKALIIGVWLLVISLFLWLPQVNLLSYILTQAPLSVGGKFSFFINYYPRVLSSFTNPIVFTLIIFSFLTAVSIVLLIFMLRTSKRLQVSAHVHGKAYAATAGSAFGSHLLSCGGTLLLAQLFPTLSGSSAAFGGPDIVINKLLATSANLIGIMIVLYTIRKISRDTYGMLLSST